MTLSLLVVTVSTVATISHKCKGKGGKTSNCFLPSLTKDSHELCVTCRGHKCSVNMCESSSSFSSFDPDDRAILISEYLSNVSCKPK